MNLRQLARDIAAKTAYRDADGRFMLRASSDWVSPVYDRRGNPLRVQRGDLYKFDLEEMQARWPGGYNYLPAGTREDAAALSKGNVAVWDMFAHVLTHYDLVTGPDSFATAGVDEGYAAEILAMLLARNIVSVAQVSAIYEKIMEVDEGLPEYAWAWR